MSNDRVPTRTESRFVYEDKPNLATIMTGGTLFAIFLYYVAGFAMEQFNFENQIIQLVFGGFVILFSFKIGTTAAVTIKIDIQSGYLEAENKQFEYTGYAHEPEIFMVLEKTSQVNGRTYKDYKLSLKVDEETTFDVPLRPEQVAQAIKNVDKAKAAVPLSR